MQVLHIISGLGDGGAEAILYRLCQYEKDHSHVVISLMDEEKYGPMLKHIGVDVYTLNNSKKKIKILSLLKLYKLIFKLKPDVVQTWMYHADFIGGFVARSIGIKNIFWSVHHTTLVGGESKLLTVLIARINSFLSYFVPKKIIYCAEMSRKTQELMGFKKNKGVVIPNGYDVEDFVDDDFKRSKFRNELNTTKDTFVIGHVGRYDPQKDHGNLIEALLDLKQRQINFKAIMIGTNLDKNNQKLVKLIKDKQLENFISLLGRRNDIPAAMNGIELFVLSSAFGEAFPNVLNEAMACGTPCVATNVGDSARIIGDTGWIVPIKDPQALSSAINEASKEMRLNKSSWTKRKTMCRKRIVENFEIKKMVKKYKDIWEECLEN